MELGRSQPYSTFCSRGLTHSLSLEFVLNMFLILFFSHKINSTRWNIINVWFFSSLFLHEWGSAIRLVKEFWKQFLSPIFIRKLFASRAHTIFRFLWKQKDAVFSNDFFSLFFFYPFRLELESNTFWSQISHIQWLSLSIEQNKWICYKCWQSMRIYIDTRGRIRNENQYEKKEK